MERQTPSRLAQHARTSSASSAKSDISATASERRSETVTVAVRLRPPNRNELRLLANEANVWQLPDPTRICLNEVFAAENRKHLFDRFYDSVISGSDNAEVYQRVARDIVRSTMEGYNGDKLNPGVIPRAVSDVFAYIREQSTTSREFLLRVAYIEVYNEQIKDLLSPENLQLKLHEDSKRGVYVSPLKEEIVTSVAQIMRVIRKGESKRHVSATDYNEHSSRSHTIFQLIVESRERGLPGLGASGRRSRMGRAPGRNAVRISQLNLIDLAGSEKASISSERRRETAYINKSLLTLGTVISKLTNENESHIPFRDSKLTRLLQTSLSGNARVAVICALAPSSASVEESLNTLKFAASIKQVVTAAHTNQVVDDKTLLQKYRLEIMELKARLIHTNEALDHDRNDEIQHLKLENRKFEEEVMELQLARTTLRERIDHLTELILTSSSSSIVEDAADELLLKADTPHGALSSGAAIVVADLKSQLSLKDREIQTLKQALENPMTAKTHGRQEMAGTMEVLAGNIIVTSDDDLVSLQEKNYALEAALKEMEANMAGLRSQVEKDVSGRYSLANFTGTQQYLELMHSVDEQGEVIGELEEECRSHKGTIAELRNTIRKLELSLFEQAEATAQRIVRSSKEAIATPAVTVANDSNALGKLQNRLHEMEEALKREKHERVQEQLRSSERVASLEADLTITKAELSVATLNI